MTLNPRASARQLQASDPKATAWVNANAGSGKTHVLVDRVIRLLLDHADPAKIMCLTFTKAAAAEMANRLFERLSEWIAIPDAALVKALEGLGQSRPDESLLRRARQLFTLALETPGGIKIQTIHAFCERVLQLFPVEAGIVPHFTMLDERAAHELLRAARDAVLLGAQVAPESELGQALHDVAVRVQSDGFDQLLSQLLSERANLHDVLEPGRGAAMAQALLRHHLGVADHETPAWVTASLGLDRKRHGDFAVALAGGKGTDLERAAVLREVLGQPDASLLNLRGFYLTKADEPRKSVANKPVKDRNPWLDDFVGEEQRRLTLGLGKLADLERISASLSVLRIGAAIVAAFEQAKRRQGAYDFDDLIIRTAELLGERPDAAWVLFKLDGGIEHLLVDEAQDTSPAQWNIIRALTDEFFAGAGRHGSKPRTVFVVGDRKQSIYSFQGADPGVFEIVHDDFERRARDAEQPFRDVDLTVSFRSAPEILDAVDAVFKPGSMARSGLDGRLARDWLHESNRRQAPGVVEVWPLTEPEDEEVSDPWQAPIDREPSHSPRRRLARYLAETIKGWIGRRMLQPEGRPVRPGDILILVRRRNSFFDALIRALWNARVPVAGADRLKLAENIAVLDLLALAQFSIMPEDDHALACILKSPILAEPLSEDGLLAIAANRAPKSLWQSLRHSPDAGCRAAVAALEPLMKTAAAARPFEFFTEVLNSARARFLARLGSEANDAIDAFLDMALGYEESNGSSLAGFVNWFEGSEAEIKRNMEQGTGEVRIMTVHGAKGLEAPIVILPDTVAVPDHTTQTPLLMLEAGNGRAKVPLWPAPKLFQSDSLAALKAARQDLQTAEYHRLLYVAMTRARDELYVCGYAGGRALPQDCWYTAVSTGLAPLLTEIAEYPGQRFGAAPVQAPSAVAVDAVERMPLPDWVSRAAPSGPPRPAPAAPRSEARTARRVARGILIHRILQHLPSLPAAARGAHIAQAVERAGHEQALAAELTALTLDPVFAEVFAENGISEVPLMTGVQGQAPERRRIDRLVPTAHDFLAVDYKTDRNWPSCVAAVNPDYLAQLASYRTALRLIHPNVPLRLGLLWTEAPHLMIIPDAILDQAADQLPMSRP